MVLGTIAVSSNQDAIAHWRVVCFRFLCILFNVPVMRTPLQILFLILVTDLPPSIALGMEPGQPGILNEYPRPKKQAIVLPWMWQAKSDLTPS